MTTRSTRWLLAVPALLASTWFAFAAPQNQRSISDVEVRLIDGDFQAVTSEELTLQLPDGRLMQPELLANGSYRFVDTGNKFTLLSNRKGSTMEPLELVFEGDNDTIFIEVCMDPASGAVKAVTSKTTERKRKNTRRRPGTPGPSLTIVPPANDDCSAAVDIACDGSASTDNTEATAAVDDPDYSCIFLGPGPGFGSVWFTFTATATEAVIDTEGSLSSDTVLAVYDGTCGAFVEIGCDDDGGTGLLSLVCLAGLTPGTTYYIQASTFSAASAGEITVNVSCGAVAGPANDECVDAELVSCNSVTTFDNSLATTALDDPEFSCHFGGSAQGVGTVWYSFVATDTSARLDTNLSLVSDTLLAVYDGSCAALTEIGCSEDEGDGFLSLLDVAGLSIGTTYIVQVASFSSGSQGEITLSIMCPAPGPPEGRCCLDDGTCLDTTEDDCLNVMGGLSWDEGLTCAMDPCPVRPDNDDCDDAIDLGALPATITFDNTGAFSDIVPGSECGVFSGPFQNVWFTVTGTGNTMTATTCTAGTIVSDTKISVFCNDCGTLPCVDGNDDDCAAGPGPLFSSSVSWCSQAGVEYLITVGTFSEFTLTGDIQLDVFDDGTPCVATVSCAPQGACCLDDGTCVVLTEGDCAAQGGEYFGDDTVCGSNAVVDPSFEGGSPSATWAEFSSTFGTPLCTAGLCGTGGGTGPNSGDWWCWFGGIAAPEVGSVSQSVTIPAGADTLDFFLEIPAASGNGVDFMNVRVDGSIVYTALESDGPYVGYLPISVDISGFADGGVHSLEFESEVTGDGGGPTNFFVDDIAISEQTVDCGMCVTLDFTTEDDFATALANGQDISTPPEFGNMVALSSTGFNYGLAIYDTDPSGPNSGAADTDLLVDLGNCLILQGEPSTQTVSGFFDTPGDDIDGGTFIFDFLAPSEVLSVDLIDIDLGPGVQDAFVTLFDAEGDTRVYSVPGGWTSDISTEGGSGFETLDLTTLAPQPGVHATATATEDPGFDALAVVRMDIFVTASAGVDNVQICQ